MTEMAQRKSITFVGWIGVVLGMAMMAAPVAAYLKTGHVYAVIFGVGAFFAVASFLWARR